LAQAFETREDTRRQASCGLACRFTRIQQDFHKAMAVINPKIGLYAQAAICLFFGVIMVLTPMSLMKEYELHVSGLALLDKLLIVSTMQGLGIFECIYSLIIVTAANRGTCDQQETTSLINGAATTFALVLTLTSVGFWEEIDVPVAGIYFNASLWGVLAALSFLGANFRPVLRLAPLRKPLYWGSLAMIVIFSCYTLVMLVAPEALLEAYTGLGLAKQSHQVLVGSLKYGYTELIVAIIMLFIGHIATTSSYIVYCVGRSMCFVSFGLALFTACWAAVWTCLNENGIYDTIVSGQRFNVGLWLVLFLLFLAPIVRMDPAIKDGVEKEVEGVYGLLK